MQIPNCKEDGLDRSCLDQTYPPGFQDLLLTEQHGKRILTSALVGSRDGFFVETNQEDPQLRTRGIQFVDLASPADRALLYLHYESNANFSMLRDSRGLSFVLDRIVPATCVLSSAGKQVTREGERLISINAHYLATTAHATALALINATHPGYAQRFFTRMRRQTIPQPQQDYVDGLKKRLLATMGGLRLLDPVRFNRVWQHDCERYYENNICVYAPNSEFTHNALLGYLLYGRRVTHPKHVLQIIKVFGESGSEDTGQFFRDFLGHTPKFDGYSQEYQALARTLGIYDEL